MANAVAKTFSHTYAGQEANEIFLRPAFVSPVLQSYARVIPNIANKRNLYLAEELRKITRKYTGCGFTPVGSLALTDKVLEVTKVRINLEQCFDEFISTYWEEFLTKGTQNPDLTDVEFFKSLIQERVKTGLTNDVFRIVNFAKSGAASADWDMFNGLWELYRIAVEVTGNVTKVGTTTYETAGILNADGAYNLFKDLYEQAPNDLRVVPNSGKEFRTPKTVVDNYLETLESLDADSSNNIKLNGIDTPAFRGIPIIAYPSWDTDLADADNPMGATLGKNIIAFTTKDNTVVGTDIITPGEDADFWYDKLTEKNNFKIKYKVGTQFIFPSMVIVAYK